MVECVKADAYINGHLYAVDIQYIITPYHSFISRCRVSTPKILIHTSRYKNNYFGMCLDINAAISFCSSLG